MAGPSHNLLAPGVRAAIVQPMAYTPTYTQVTLPNGRRTFVVVALPTRRNSNPKHVAVTAPTLGANTHFRGGKHA